MTSNVEDAARILQVIAGYDALESANTEAYLKQAGYKHMNQLLEDIANETSGIWAQVQS